MITHPPLIKITNHWLVVNKPAGLNVEQLWDYPSVEMQVKDYLRSLHPREPYLGIVHRLDRPVSGVLIMARKKSTLRHLNQQFAERKVEKTYWAMTQGKLPKVTGTLEHYLVKDQKNKRAEAYDSSRKNAIYARLQYRVLACEEGVSCVEIQPHTGKFHQIRVQMAAVGCPLIGDVKYGGPEVHWPNSIALHARQLGFTNPQTEERELVTAPVPDENNLWAKWDVIGAK